jgi:ribosome-associated protein
VPRLTEPHPDARARAQVAAVAAAVKKGSDLAILSVGEVLSIIDLFVLVSATNVRQVRTIVEEVEQALTVYDGSEPISVEGLGDASWVLLDYGDVVVHVFLDETRAYYDLDRLWADVPHLNVPVGQPAT